MSGRGEDRVEVAVPREHVMKRPQVRGADKEMSEWPFKPRERVYWSDVAGDHYETVSRCGRIDGVSPPIWAVVFDDGSWMPSDRLLRDDGLPAASSEVPRRAEIELLVDEVEARMSWGEYLMALAKTVSRKSKDPRTKVGCVIVGEDHEVLSTGFNGMPIGVSDRDERMLPPAKYLFTSHAEENAVAFAARNGHQLKGSTAYVTHPPCSRCARMLIQSGVRAVVVGGGTTNMPAAEFEAAAEMFADAGIAYKKETSDV